MDDTIEDIFIFIIGTIFGIILFCMSLPPEKLISKDFTCAKTTLIGASPYRHEQCMEYIRKSQQ